MVNAFPVLKILFKTLLLIGFLLTINFSTLIADIALLELKTNSGRNIAFRHNYSSIISRFETTASNYQTFTDLRAHYLKKDAWAANAGIGVRLHQENPLGFNIYYDVLKEEKAHHQIGFGGEIFSEILEFRYNFYIPIGKKRQLIEKHRFRYPPDYRVDYSQKKGGCYGIDFELGKNFSIGNHFQLYGGIGGFSYLPYCFEVRSGVKARTELRIGRYLTAGFIASNDNFYHTLIQGVFSLSLNLGGDNQDPISNLNPPVYRQELIVRDTCNTWETNY